MSAPRLQNVPSYDLRGAEASGSLVLPPVQAARSSSSSLCPQGTDEHEPYLRCKYSCISSGNPAPLSSGLSTSALPSIPSSISAAAFSHPARSTASKTIRDQISSGSKQSSPQAPDSHQSCCTIPHPVACSATGYTRKAPWDMLGGSDADDDADGELEGPLPQAVLRLMLAKEGVLYQVWHMGHMPSNWKISLLEGSPHHVALHTLPQCLMTYDPFF